MIQLYTIYKIPGPSPIIIIIIQYNVTPICLYYNIIYDNTI